MLRLTHLQQVSGALPINDIDDGLPNKTAKHGTGNPDQYHRDGNSLGGADKSVEPGVNYLKQKCYVPFYKVTSATTHDVTVKGYIDLAETDRVLISQNRGVIAGLVRGSMINGARTPLISVTSFVAADVAASVLTSAVLDTTLTLTGTGFESLDPNVSSVVITGSGAKILTRAQIVAAVGGSFSDTSIVIPASLLTGVLDLTSTIQVLTNDLLSNVKVVNLTAPVITTAVIGATNITITGNGFIPATAGALSLVFTGTGAITLTQAQLTGATITNTSIVMAKTLAPSAVITDSSVNAVVDTIDSNIVALT